MSSVLSFRCPRCHFFAPRFTRILLHLENVHALEPDFQFKCGVEGCQKSYKIIGSFRSHLYRHHKRWVSIVCHDSELEPAEASSDSAARSDLDFTLRDPDASATGATPSSSQPGPSASASSSSHATCSEQDPPSDPPSLQSFMNDLQQRVCKLFFGMAEERKVPYSVCESLFREVEDLLHSSLQSFAQYVRHELRTSYFAVPEQLAYALDCMFFQGVFDQIRSKYQRTQCAKANFPYTQPEQHSYADDDRSSFQYIPIGSVLQNLVQCRAVQEHLIEPDVDDASRLCSFREGAEYRRQMGKNLVTASEKLFHILLYMDELEVVNPLGPARGMHRIVVVYYSLLNIHARFRSKLHLLHLAVIAKYADVQKYGLPVALSPLLDELRELESTGIPVQIAGRQMCLKAVVLACCGDNLSMNRLGGFSCSFARGSVCRFCMAQASQLASITKEQQCQVRTKQVHESHLTAIKVNPTLYKRLYGVNEETAMACLEGFDPTVQLPPDIMHDLFEGAFPFVLQCVLKGLHQDGLITPSDLAKVTTFHYGVNDRAAKPPEISEAFLTSKGTIKGTASQKWCLFRRLPQILASGIPEGNVHWEVYLLLREVTDIVLADELTSQAVFYLEIKIQEFLREFVACYPSARLIPKLHYLIHYPRMISYFGPLKQVWCMRFEAKHQYFKNLAMKVKNFKNICKTLAERHQLLQSYQFSDLVLDEPVCMTGIKPVERSALHLCVQDARPAGTVWQAKSATVMNVTYCVGGVLIMRKGDNPEFSQIVSIFLAETETVLLLEKMEVVEFRRHRYALRVSRSGVLCAGRPGDEAAPDCLDLYFYGEVVPRCDVALFD